MSALVDYNKIATTLTRRFGNLDVRVIIVDVAHIYGQERYLVKVDGQYGGNMCWINA